jgi:hypothetical protein
LNTLEGAIFAIRAGIEALEWVNWGFVVFIIESNFALKKISMSGINSGHHNLPTYEMSLKSDNVEFVRYCGGHFENFHM